MNNQRNFIDRRPVLSYVHTSRIPLVIRRYHHSEPASYLIHCSCSRCRLRPGMGALPLLISTLVKEIHMLSFGAEAVWRRHTRRILWTHPPLLHAPSSNGEDKWTDSGGSTIRGVQKSSQPALAAAAAGHSIAAAIRKMRASSQVGDAGATRAGIYASNETTQFC